MALAQKAIRLERLTAARHKLGPRLRLGLIICGSALVAVGVGAAVARGGTGGNLVILAAMAVGGGTLVSTLFGARLSGALALEVPLVAILVSNQVLRVREAADIASNPVDSAGAFRVGLVGLAGLLGVAALLLPRHESLA